MTADRWWVRVAARWLARIDGVSGQIRLFSLGLTAFSTFSLVLQSFGLGRFVPVFGVGLLAGGLVFAYLYSEGGVWNQVSRDRADMSGNFASPGMRIDDELIARGMCAGRKGAPLDEEEREAIVKELDTAWERYRDGVHIND
jgi:hypothetical protein